MQHCMVVKWKHTEGNVCGMIRDAIPAIVRRDRGSLQKILVRISCLRSQIWTQAAPSMKQKCDIWVAIFFFTWDLSGFCVIL